MKRSVIFPLTLFCLIILVSCKKLVDDKKQEVLMAVITSGKWHVEEYIEATVDVTSQFDNYDFKFNGDGTVISNNGINNTTGTWSGDIQNYSINSSFPTTENPLKKLNGIWKVIDSTEDFVDAEMVTGAGKMILHLRKNP